MLKTLFCKLGLGGALLAAAMTAAAASHAVVEVIPAPSPTIRKFFSGREAEVLQ